MIESVPYLTTPLRWIKFSLIDSSFFHLVGDNFFNIAGSGLFGDENEQSKIVLNIIKRTMIKSFKVYLAPLRHL